MLLGILSVIFVLLLAIDELPFDADTPFELALFPLEFPCAKIGAAAKPATKVTVATIAMIAIKFNLDMHIYS
jgi:hypothetical protein